MQQFSDLQTQSERYRETYYRNGRKVSADCTVKALAGCFNLSYGKAHRTMRKAGRADRCGANILTISKGIATITGETLDTVKNEMLGSFKGKSKVTLNRFCRENPKGIFYACTTDHAICIRDGQLIDWTADTAGRRKIQYIYKVKRG